MLKKSFILCLLLILPSCMVCLPGYYKYQYEKSSELPKLTDDNVLSETDSIIITKISNKVSLKDSNYQEKWGLLGMGWVNKDAKFELAGKPTSLSKGFMLSPKNKDGALISFQDSQTKFDFYTLKSGEYFLGNIGNVAVVEQITNCFAFFHFRDGRQFAVIDQLKPGQTWINPQYLADKKGDVLSASFLANPNEIVYIGDLISL